MLKNEEKDVSSNFSKDELEKLNSVYGGYCFTNSLVDFYESDDDNDDGSTIFAYTDTRRYM